MKIKSDCRIIIANIGYLFGLEDFINSRPRTTTTKCVSQESFIFKIKGSNFISLI